MTTALTRATTTGVQTQAPSASAPSVGQRSKRAYLHHVDLIRATTFSLVIFVHCLTQTTDEFTSLPVNTTSMLLHFTRNTFFALTGFVLMYQNFDKRDFSTFAFWRRRIKLVIFPYVIWSFIYWVVEDMWVHGRLREVPTSLNEFGKLAMWGLSGFQMYFLFVMLQVYLLFPLVLWLVRATVGKHKWVLLASLAAQLAITATITYWEPPASIATYWWHNYATFIRTSSSSSTVRSPQCIVKRSGAGSPERAGGCSARCWPRPPSPWVRTSTGCGTTESRCTTTTPRSTPRSCRFSSWR